MLRIFGAVLVAVLLTACAGASSEYSGSTGKTLLVTQNVWDAYKDYVTKISGVNKGVFVVGVYNDTAEVASYYYCPGPSCMADNFSGKALERCRSYGADLNCIVFANGTSIIPNYKVIGD
jgi:hypothetical protein